MHLLVQSGEDWRRRDRCKALGRVRSGYGTDQAGFLCAIADKAACQRNLGSARPQSWPMSQSGDCRKSCDYPRVKSRADIQPPTTS